MFFCSCSSNNKLLRGRWVSESTYECNYYIVFNNDHTYEVYNDCYSLSIDNSLIEIGKYNLDDGKLYLNDRNLVAKFDFLDFTGRNYAELLNISSEKLELCFLDKSDNNCIVEKYIKVK